MRVGVRRADDHAFQQAFGVQVRGVAGRSVGLLGGFGARDGRCLPAGRCRVVVAGAGRGHRPEDSLVGAAAAEVAGKGCRDLFAARPGGAVLGAPPFEEGRRLDHEPGGAVAALEGVLAREGACDEVVRQALHGRHPPSGQPGCGGQAGHPGLAVDLDRAGPAHAARADQFGAGQSQAVAHHLHGGRVVVHVDRAAGAIDLELHETYSSAVGW